MTTRVWRGWGLRTKRGTLWTMRINRVPLLLSQRAQAVGACSYADSETVVHVEVREVTSKRRSRRG